VSKDEIIRGEEAIREAIQAWRRFLIENWRSEPLRLTTAIPRGKPPFHLVEFQGGHTGWLGYMGTDIRYPLYCGCNLVFFTDGYKPPQKLFVGIPDFSPGELKSLPAIVRIQATLAAIYDPLTLLFYCIADSSRYGFARGESITAREIVERSEQAFQQRERDDYGND
jgi:hypothetical protein